MPDQAALARRGARVIEHVVAAPGTELVNRVWKDTTLLPTEEEIAAPDVWVGRIAF